MVNIFRRKAGLVGLMSLLAVVVPLAISGTAQAVTIPAHGQVYNGDSPRCLDSGTPTGALLFNCSTSIYQQWVYNSSDEIVGNSPTGCLTEAGTTNGSRAVLETCTGATSQQWSGNPYGSSEYVNVASGKCLDADLGTIGGQGTIVQVWSCGGASNQLWTFQYPPSTLLPPPPPPKSP
jgi:Ricin-type beta-trefoil lectin domain